MEKSNNQDTIYFTPSNQPKIRYPRDMKNNSLVLCLRSFSFVQAKTIPPPVELDVPGAKNPERGRSQEAYRTIFDGGGGGLANPAFTISKIPRMMLADQRNRIFTSAYVINSSWKYHILELAPQILFQI